MSTIYSLNCHKGIMLSTICSTKQKSLQMYAELRHCQRWVTNRQRQRVPQWRTRDGKTCYYLLKLPHIKSLFWHESNTACSLLLTSSSRPAPIPYYSQIALEVNLSFPSVWLYRWLFLYRSPEAATAAYAYLNLSLLDNITLLPLSNIMVMCKESGALNFMWPNETFM